MASYNVWLRAALSGGPPILQIDDGRTLTELAAALSERHLIVTMEAAMNNRPATPVVLTLSAIDRIYPLVPSE